MAKILLLNGPNLNLLGTREPAIYGGQTLAGLETALRDEAGQAGHELLSFQSNAEHELIERIHAAANEGVGFILFNPAAFTHTSVALRDALSAVSIPFIEIHISNIYAREDFRRDSFFSDLALGTICGLGQHGYRLALEAAVNYLNNT
ncbi:MAG TPA: type II 3-dehydroquinate dehydratase [Gammaproteobacteria bacterium]|nr:type II 3-dehydroquinate dehydratase [Gammaproteobacteria bacterium]